MLELVRFYLFSRKGHVRRTRNGTAASIVFFLFAGYAFGAVWIASWAHWDFTPTLAGAPGLLLILGATLVCRLLLPEAIRVHRILEKYQDPIIWESELFRTYDQDVGEALLSDSFGRTKFAVQKLEVAVSVNPKNAQAAHLLSMIKERDRAGSRAPRVAAWIVGGLMIFLIYISMELSGLIR